MRSAPQAVAFCVLVALLVLSGGAPGLPDVPRVPPAGHTAVECPTALAASGPVDRGASTGTSDSLIAAAGACRIARSHRPGDTATSATPLWYQGLAPLGPFETPLRSSQPSGSQPLVISLRC